MQSQATETERRREGGTRDRSVTPFKGMQPVEGWAHKSLGLAAVSYTVMTAYGLFYLDWNLAARVEEIIASIVLCIAFFGSARAPLAAVVTSLTVILLEIGISIFNTGSLISPSYGVLPVVVIASGLLLGGRAALATGVAAALLAPLAVYLSGAWEWDLSKFDRRGDGLWLVVGELAIVVCALLTRFAVNAYLVTWRASERTRRRYSELFDNAPDGLVAIGRGGIIQDINVAGRRMLGLDRMQLKDRLFNEAWAEAGGQGCMELESLRAGSNLQSVLEDRNGTRRSIEFSVRTDPTAGSEILLVMRDITDRDSLVEKLGHGQRLEMVGRLAGGIAHDFNNLLTVVAGDAAILSNHPDPEVRALASEVFEAQRKGSNLVRQLLSFARRDMRRPEVIDLGIMIRGIRRLLERMLGEQCQLEVQSDPRVGVVADLAQMEQVVLNLVSNARDAMPSGGVVRVNVRLLSVAAARELGSVLSHTSQSMLEVEDSGLGMRPEVKARLFEPFFTTKPRGQGTGLGLSSVHGIVVQSGGAVMVDSAPGEGTRVRIFLPHEDKLPSEGSIPERMPAAEVEHAGPAKILFVEDEQHVRALGVRVLTRAGHEVVEASNAEEALAVFSKEGGFDLICTDVVMPGLSGPEMVAKLRSQRGKATPPVLFMSGYFKQGIEEADELLQEGVLLQKPFAPEQLISSVDSLLALRHQAV